MKLTVTIGPPGAGKSTWANTVFGNDIYTEIINPDSIREELTGDASDQSKNGAVFAIAHRRLQDAANDGINAVFDATSTSTKAINQLLKLIPMGSEVDLVFFLQDVSVCLERNRNRPRFVPENIIHTKCQQTQQMWDSNSLLGDLYLKNVRRIYMHKQEG